MYIIHTLWKSCLNVYKPVVLVRYMFTNYATVTIIQIPEHFHNPVKKCGDFPGDSVSKESACNAGDPGSILGLGRSPRGGNGNPSLYSCLGNPMDRGDWRATVHEVARVGHNWGLNLPTKKKPKSTFCNFPFLSSAQPTEVTSLQSVSMDWTILHISCK